MARPEDFGAVKVGPRPEDFGAVVISRQPEKSEPTVNLEALKDTAKDFVTGGGLRSLKDVAMGGLRGATRIGTTLLRPFDSSAENKERVASVNEFFRDNSNPQSFGFQAGDIGTQIAGTAGVGGALAKGVMGASRAIPAISNIAPKVATALETGGFRLAPPGVAAAGNAVGNAAIRTGAGAVTGGAMAGLVDPEQAGTGAMIGGALPGAVKVAGMAGSGLRSAGEHILGAMTGTSAETLRNALEAGKRGATEFLDNMRGNTSFDEVVTQAKRGLANMRKERATAYRSGMVNIKNDKTVLDMTPINDAVDAIKQSGNFRGKVINQKAGGVIDEIDAVVSDWSKSNPSEFHTPEGLDALKQAVGDIRDSTQFGTPARRAADSVYNAIKNEIKAQAPTYEKVMKDYASASETISEIERALVGGEKGSKDTAIRKLQSLMRNNAQTNYGNRTKLAQTLETQGNVDLFPSIAGQAMSSWLPRGMIGSLEKAGMAGGIVGGAAGVPYVAPAAIALAPLSSPRLVGEAAYGLGRLSGASGNVLNGILGSQLGQQPVNELMANPAIRNLLLRSTVTTP